MINDSFKTEVGSNKLEKKYLSFPYKLIRGALSF